MIYDAIKEIVRPAWPPGIEVQAQCYDAFDLWRQERDPDGEMDLLEAIELYAAEHTANKG